MSTTIATTTSFKRYSIQFLVAINKNQLIFKMRVNTQVLQCVHLDPGYALLSVQNCIIALEMFRMLDIHNNASLNDCQFKEFLHQFSDLNSSQSDTFFELLDIDRSGEMEFEEFYLVFCIIVSCKDQYEKEFIYRHSTNIFRLIDADESGNVSAGEFQQMGVLFNFDYNSIHSIFNEFDISGDKKLDFKEFRLFTMACIDEQRSAEAQLRVNVLTDYHNRLINGLEFLIRMYIITLKAPKPSDIYHELKKIAPPNIPEKRRRYSFFDPVFFTAKLGSCFQQIKKAFSKFFALLKFLFCLLCCKSPCCHNPKYKKKLEPLKEYGRSVVGFYKERGEKMKERMQQKSKCYRRLLLRYKQRQMNREKKSDMNMYMMKAAERKARGFGVVEKRHYVPYQKFKASTHKFILYRNLFLIDSKKSKVGEDNKSAEEVKEKPAKSVNFKLDRKKSHLPVSPPSPKRKTK